MNDELPFIREQAIFGGSTPHIRLRHCARCGCVGPCVFRQNPHGYVVVCPECPERTPWMPTGGAAVDAWNEQNKAMRSKESRS